MAKGKKEKKEINNLKKRLLGLERKYGFNYNNESTSEYSEQIDSPIYKKDKNFSDIQTNSEPEKRDSFEVESIKRIVDNKVAELKGEIKTETNYLRTKIDNFNELIRTEGNILRTNYLSKNLFFWVISTLIVIVSGIGAFIYNNVEKDLDDINTKIEKGLDNITEDIKLENWNMKDTVPNNNYR